MVAAVGPAGASVVGATGLTTAGQPYYDLSALLPGGTLAAGVTSNSLTLQMKNPTAASMQLDLHVYGRPTAVNQAPTAHAGPDQTAFVGAAVTLDGSKSTDVDGDLLTYRWSLRERPAGSNAALAEPTAIHPTVVLDWPGVYVVQLVVDDGALDSTPATVTLSTENSRPSADAGPDQRAFVGATVFLDGAGSRDPDFDPLAYIWALLDRPADSAAVLDGATTRTPSLAIDRRGSYLVQLVVSDGVLASAPDTVAITTENARPVADAGPDQTAAVGDTVVLDGRGSHDADGDPLDYQWALLSVPEGSAAALDGATTATATLAPDLPGLYVAQLIVSDGELASDPDTARVEIRVGNQRPEITSTPPDSAIVGVAYSYAVAATDPEGGALTFALTTAPAAMTIDAATGLIAWTPGAGDLGDHPVTVRVADPEGATAIQSFTVTVTLPGDCAALPPGSPGACGATGLSTDRAPPGTELIIQGYGFDPDPDKNLVTLCGVRTQVIAVSAASIRVRVPLTGVGSECAVVVTTPRGTMTGLEFTIVRAQDFLLVASPAAIDIFQGSRRAVQLEVGNAGAAGFQGVVELATGDLPAGVTLNFLPPALTVGRKGTVLVAVAGDAPPGRYPIEVRGTGYTSGIVQTHGTAFTLEIRASHGAVSGVAGRYVTPEGAGIPGVIVRAEPVGAYGTSLGQTVTDAAGDFALRDLPAGVLILRIDATPADPGYPIFPVSITVEGGLMSRLKDWVLRRQPADEHFSPLVPGSPQEQVITDPRYPGVAIRLLAGTSIIGWDGVAKSRMAIERIEPDRLPVDPPLIGAKSYYQLFFGTPMGGVPSNPILVTLPNELGLDPGQQADLYYFDGAPTSEGVWKKSGTGTVSADGSVIVTDPGSGIPRFCGVCGLSCFIRQDVIPSPPCPDCDPQGPPQKAGNPVTLGLGMELPSVVDLQIDGVMPITIGRVYNPWNHFVKNSQLRPSFGHGWYFNYDVAIYGSGSALRVVMPGNGRVDFQPDGSGDYVAPGDLRFGGARLVSGSGGLEMRFKDGRVWRFTNFGLAGYTGGVYFLTEQLDGKGNSLRIERNGFGRPTTIAAPGRSVSIGIGGSGNGYIEEIRDALGRRVRYLYPDGRLAQVTAPDGRTTGYSYESPPPPKALMVSGPGGGDTYSVSSGFGPGSDGPTYIKTMSFPGVAEPLVLDYSKSYRVVRETFGNQYELRFSYELSGACAVKEFQNQLPSTCAGPNGPTEESWDTVQAGWWFFGGTVAATRVTDANGNGFKVRFNGAGLGIELEDALGQITQFERDAQNRITAATDPLGRVTRYEYDGNSNVTRIVEPGGRATDLGYDPKWNKVATITRTLDDGAPVTYRFEYDQGEYGRLLRAIDPLGHATGYGYTAAGGANSLIERVTDPLGRVTRLVYGGRADLAGVIDPLGNAVALQHDVLGRLLQVTDALGATTASEYNVLDQITRILDANGGQTRFAYDAKRDPVSVVDPLNRAVETYVTDNLHRLTHRVDAVGAGESYQYDRAGRLTSAVDRKGQQVRLSYDRLDRVTGIEYADGNVESRDYDAVGRLVRITDAAGTVAFEYDDLDRLVKETTEYGGRINSVEYRYDALDRLVARTVNGADPTTYSYDLASRLLTIGFRGATVRYEWDAASRLRVKTLPNGTRQEYAYDAADRLLEIRFVRGDGSLIDGIAYQYDANGRRIGKITGLPSNDETPITGAYDQANRMTRVTFTATGETCALEYDANGNLTAKDCPGGTTRYTWDAQDRLIAIDGPGVTASFRYDALGRRIERTVNGATTGYLYDGVQTIAEFGAEDAALLTGLAIDEALGRFAGRGDLTLLTDALGSVVAEARADESVATRYGYSPYGETVRSGEESGSSTRYTGREEDGTGMYYYRARYYESRLKQFLTEDPIRSIDSGAASLYRYVNGDPLNLLDPFGLFVMFIGSDVDVAFKLRGFSLGGYLAYDTDCGFYLCGFRGYAIGLAAGATLGVGFMPAGINSFQGLGANASGGYGPVGGSYIRSFDGRNGVFGGLSFNPANFVKGTGSLSFGKTLCIRILPTVPQMYSSFTSTMSVLVRTLSHPAGFRRALGGMP